MKSFVSVCACLLGLSAANAKQFQVGDRIDSLANIVVHKGFPPEKVDIVNYIADRTVVLLGLPGVQVPGYLKLEEDLTAVGVEEVIVYCVNDGAVMQAWGENQKIANTYVTFVADPFGDLTRGLDVLMDHPGPAEVGIINRCKRNVIVFKNGVAKYVAVAEGDGDPAGDAKPDVTLAEAVLETLTSTKTAREL